MMFKLTVSALLAFGLQAVHQTIAAPVESARPPALDGKTSDASARAEDVRVARIRGEFIAGMERFASQHSAVRELKSLNTVEARAVLRSISLGEYPNTRDNLQGWAARNLISLDSREAWQLLAASKPEVLNPTVQALRGQTVDSKFLEPLKKCARHDNLLVRRLAIHVLAEDPKNRYITETLAAVDQAFADVAALPNLDELLPPAKVSQQCTVSEHEYSAYWSLLSDLRVEDAVLRDFAKLQKGRGRDMLIIALGVRGDQLSHDDLVRICRDKDAGRFRAWAAIAIEKVHVPADLELLRTLAEGDPLTRMDVSCTDPDRGPEYPVRQAAMSTIMKIERRQIPKIQK